MPVVDGFLFADWLIYNGYMDTPIIMMIESYDGAILERLEEYRLPWIKKPFKPNDLYNKIEKL
jgi:CheY-like chemotaxis protein